MGSRPLSHALATPGDILDPFSFDSLASHPFRNERGKGWGTLIFVIRIFIIRSLLFNLCCSIFAIDQLRMLAGAGGLGFLHQAAGVGDEVGYFEGFYQAGHAFVLEEAAHVGLGHAGESKQ
jgi:hypothetical protein